MDQTYLLVLLFAVAALVGLLAFRFRYRKPPAPDGSDSPFAASTEGMKVCPFCGMGNLWTERTCISCGGPLRG